MISEVNGTWAAAREVAGGQNSGYFAWVASVSCASAGNCSAGGAYDYGGYNAPFVVSEKDGVWGQAIDVPGGLVRDDWLSSVSCASAGNCGAVGGYDGAGSGAFVVIKKDGVWGKRINLPGDDIASLSCAPTGSCVGGGSYARAGLLYLFQGFGT